MSLGMMAAGDSPTLRQQPLVFLYVGDQIFKVSQPTLKRYPNSLLAKMLDEYQKNVARGEALYVDRDPTAFPWIREIYRGGDYCSCIPDMPQECLQRELTFYRLPTLEQLGLNMTSILPTRETAAEKLMDQILNEIKQSGLEELFTWDIYVYHKIVDDKLDPVRRVCVRVPAGFGKLDYVYLRGHAEFYTALECSYLDCKREKMDDRLILEPHGTNVKYAVTLATETLLGILREEADSIGAQPLRLRTKFIKYDGTVSDYHMLRIAYKEK